MQKIVINTRHGGFYLSEAQLARYHQQTDYRHYLDWNIPRNCPVLVSMVEGMTHGNSDQFSGCKLKVVEIPDGVEWEIGEYDGREWVAEKHRIWE